MIHGKKHSPEHEQFMSTMRQIDAASANGKTHPVACREVGITGQTFYRRRKERDGLKVVHATDTEAHPTQSPVREGRLPFYFPFT